MSCCFLAIDFGTTSTKSALVDLDSGHFFNLQRHTSAPPAVDASAGPAAGASGPAPAVAGRHELSIAYLLERFGAICSQAYKQQAFEGIVLCSEMHGFVVLDETGQPRTNYVSWLDARSQETVDGGPSTHDLIVERLGADFHRLTGMRPRPGFPLLNLTHTARTGELDLVSGWVLSLPAALARLSHGGNRPDLIEHPTMLAAMALADVSAGCAGSQELLGLIEEIGGFRAQVGATCGEGQIAGHWPGPGGLIPIYAGVGDHQCSVLGAAPEPGADANLNLGTGSQVGIVDGPIDTAFELRPYFDGRHLTAVTHIPAGRALSEYIGFLERIATYAGGQADFWDAMARLEPEQVGNTDLQLDLAIFEGARGWHAGGTISGITEGSLDVDSYLAALLRAFTQQYIEVLQELDPASGLQRLVLSGGIARRLPQLSRMLATATTYQVLPAVDLDESLLGLRSLALQASGRAATVAEAAAVFGRQCHIDRP